MESPCSLGRGKPAAAPAVTLGEDRRIPSCCCGMLGSRICFLRGGGRGVGVYSSGGGAAAGGVGGWGGGGRLWRLRGRRDALEREETRRLYLSRTPLQAVPCSWQHPGMAKEGTPTQIHAHADTRAGTHSYSYCHPVERLITGLSPLNSKYCGVGILCVGACMRACNSFLCLA